MRSLVELAAHFATETRGYVSGEIGRLRDELSARIADIKTTPGEKGERGEKGDPGNDAQPVNMEEVIAAVLARMPAPKDGEPGKDAPPVDMLALAQSVLALIPTPRDGRDGVASRDELIALVNAKVAESLDTVVAQRVEEELAKRPDVRYRDVWTAENRYREGNLVTFGGSIWHCNATGTNAKPGDNTDDWTLAVKKGRDGNSKGA